MELEIRKYNILALEPEDIAAQHRIAKDVVEALEAKAKPLSDFIKSLRDNRLISQNTSLNQVMEDARGLEHPAILKDLRVPEDERFFMKFHFLGDELPKKMSELSRVYGALGDEDAHIFLINTASKGEVTQHCLDYLSDSMESEFPKLCDSTWIFTNSLRCPIPKPFASLLDSIKTAKMKGDTCYRNGSSSDKDLKRYTVMDGAPYRIGVGDTMVESPVAKAAEVIYDRLRWLRKDPTRHLKKVEGRTK